MELLSASANGKQIVFDPAISHTATHFKDTPILRALVCELLEGLNLEGDVVAKDIDMGRAIGNTDVIETNETDEIVYAVRKHREDQGHVPFTKSRKPEPCSLISIYLVKKDTETYELTSAWIGAFESPPFPQMKNATAESVPYWSKRAFVWGSQEIIPGSELSRCPWL